MDEMPKPSRFLYLLNKQLQEKKNSTPTQSEKFKYLRMNEDGTSSLSESALGPEDFRDTPKNRAMNEKYKKQYKDSLAKVIAEKQTR